MLISIIVPVYNVSKYLEKCLDSIINQTYRNLEIILVDDGSTDDSGKICENYAQIDSRIKVIHTENQGAAEARNSGLEVAKGECIGFVDGDDWIEHDSYKNAYEMIQKYNADIVAWGHSVVVEEKINKTVRNDGTIQVLNTAEALDFILKDERLQSFLWDKLFKREMFEGLRLKRQCSVEDIDICYQLIMKAKNIVLYNKAQYYYFQRKNSTQNQRGYKVDIDQFLIFLESIEKVSPQYPHLREFLVDRLCKYGVYVYSMILQRRYVETNLDEAQTEIRRNILLYKKEIFSSKCSPLALKVKIWFLDKAPKVYNIMYASIKK